MLPESLHALLGGESLVLADVGASYFMPDTWMQLVPLPQTRFVLFDPVGKNLEYAKQLPAGRAVVIPSALSRDGGLAELFVSNVDSGSSILPPQQWPHRPALPHDYFFPLRVVDVETKTMHTALDEHGVAEVHAIKLDTQGSELDIVRGLDAKRLSRLVMVEMEVSMTNPPTYVGAARLPDVITFFEDNGFRYVNTRIERRSLQALGCTGPAWSATIPAQHECDAIFVRDVLATSPDRTTLLADLRRLITLLCAYYMHGEAIEVLRVAAAELGPDARGTLAAMEQGVAACAEQQAARIASGMHTTWHAKVA